MFEETPDDMPIDTPHSYVVFPCSKCGKWTYAKADQKARKCGICKTRHKIEEISEYELTEGVANAAKLARSKNNSWQANKGIKLDPLITHSPPKSKSSKKNNNNCDDELNQNAKYEEILQKIRKNVVETHLPQPIPQGYLAVLYELYAGGVASFARFLRYGLQIQKLYGNNMKGYTFV